MASVEEGQWSADGLVLTLVSKAVVRSGSARPPFVKSYSRTFSLREGGSALSYAFNMATDKVETETLHFEGYLNRVESAS